MPKKMVSEIKVGKREQKRTYAETFGPWLLLPWNCIGPPHSLASGSSGMLLEGHVANTVSAVWNHQSVKRERGEKVYLYFCDYTANAC